MILRIVGLSSKAYVEFSQQIWNWRPACPSCYGYLTKNGGYSRLLTLDKLPEPAEIYKKYCENCRLSFTLLPEDVLPLHSYGLEFVSARVMASIDGVSLRSRDFYEKMGLAPVAAADEPNGGGLSWSDYLELEPLTPSYQLFHRWRQRFSQRAQVWLRWLMVACVMGGCDLRTRLGESLEEFGKCPEDLYALLLAAGLVGLLQDRPVRLCFGDTLRLLCGAIPGSPKLLRAAGRPPPHYGRDLEFPHSGRR